MNNEQLPNESQHLSTQNNGLLRRLFLPYWSGEQADQETARGKRAFLQVIVILVPVFLLTQFILMLYWGNEPNLFDVGRAAQARAGTQQENTPLVPGYVATSTLMELGSTLLEKPGGYLSNDVVPPTLLMDNIPNWEFGVLTQIRDFSRSLRNDISRSQTQSIEDPNLAEAEPNFNFDSGSWFFTERKYRKAIGELGKYLDRLADDNQADGQFFARADNLREWLKVVEKRLGSLSQRLSASTDRVRLNTDLSGEPHAVQSTPGTEELAVKTSWLEIDDVFYETRGTCWALIHLLRAVEIDFKSVLEKKNALVSLRQITRELEATQGTVWSPVILNGGEFGLFANHSLVMSSYISRANAAVIDLRSLLAQG
uniref:DUF2333 domain-containing protein n=1 Tax=Candidatus Kentrum sp. FM TaxID=2126340 RepID=A0A450VTQ2_9GAMM|nr:MAG: hypothetical protein BECKFM1743A_GA0114220_100602 [Candidatus Kentron sp. FM]VFJ48704.1 MAG: hypothetical protein BECKFM1743C_GA0114222_1006210 [Candidatus Kentron sp. FM]VFK08164.1 MAG: hypothetical protein BECKFM1743B_GA0114221_100612 [Candidatus Kentron sp. FM]